MAPVVDTGLFNFGRQPGRYRNNNDPISMFDRSAKPYERKHDASNKAFGIVISVIGIAIPGNEKAVNWLIIWLKVP
eukprot:6451893-Alexandrium_andersonii.AAC.1